MVEVKSYMQLLVDEVSKYCSLLSVMAKSEKIDYKRFYYRILLKILL